MEDLATSGAKKAPVARRLEVPSGPERKPQSGDDPLLVLEPGEVRLQSGPAVPRERAFGRLAAIVQAFKRAMFGRRSEKLDPGQLELALEDAEQEFAEARAEKDAVDPAMKAARAGRPRCATEAPAADRDRVESSDTPRFPPGPTPDPHGFGLPRSSTQAAPARDHRHAAAASKDLQGSCHPLRAKDLAHPRCDHPGRIACQPCGAPDGGWPASAALRQGLSC